ncbi:hypothetical protein [Yoonia vestfoldensis]|uniref:hypothetical protein n=1 Tax=Yoonia vestfoldensis TaxID=245188 RepID=UPI00036C3D2E|nr:hypothetical protein [Yoonia vestfoldensis]
MDIAWHDLAFIWMPDPSRGAMVALVVRLERSADRCANLRFSGVLRGLATPW